MTSKPQRVNMSLILHRATKQVGISKLNSKSRCESRS